MIERKKSSLRNLQEAVVLYPVNAAGCKMLFFHEMLSLQALPLRCCLSFCISLTSGSQTRVGIIRIYF